MSAQSNAFDPRQDFSPGEPLVFLQLDAQNINAPFDKAQADKVAGEFTTILKNADEIKANWNTAEIDLTAVGVQRTGIPIRAHIEDFCSVFRDGERAHVLLRLKYRDKFLEHSDENRSLTQITVQVLNRQIGRLISGVGTVQLVLPDLIMTGANHGSSGSGGGPGAPPQAISRIVLGQMIEHMINKKDYPDTAWPFHVRFTGKGKKNTVVKDLVRRSRHGQSVTVLVLDTAPDPDRIKKPPKDNALLKSLRQTLFYDNRPGVRPFAELPKTKVWPLGGGNHYEMIDHGLFVAGIVHDIAPGADIELWRVLNEYGAGNLSTLFDAFAEALILAQGQEDPVVINLSLVINLPLDKIDEQWGDQFEKRFGDTLNLVIKEYLGTKCVAVAAAGNGSSTAAHQLPHYPARFDPVMAVAAAAADGDAAGFSDQGDEVSTGPNGVATIGGDAEIVNGKPRIRNNPHTGFPDALIGVVTSKKVPEGEMADNETGWAAWAGTSFATPVATGLIACCLSGTEAAGGGDAPSTDAIIQEITNLAADSTPKGKLRVDGLNARQL